MEVDFFVSETLHDIIITNNDGVDVARFARSQHGRWAYHSFCYGMSAKGMTLFDMDANQFAIGTVAQMMGKAA